MTTSNTILFSSITSSRQIYGMAKQKSLPKFLSKVHGKTRTPWIAILITMFVAIIFTFIGEIDLVANITNLFLFLTFAAVNLSLIILRYKAPKMKRAFKCPLNCGRLAIIPLLGLITSLVMIVFIIWGFL